MLRKIFGLALLIGMLGVMLAAPAAAQQRRAIDRVERNGVMYTVYEEKRPNDPNTYLYYVEDGALGGSRSSNLKFYKRENGMESAAFIAATLLFAASVLAIHRRSNLMNLLHR